MFWRSSVMEARRHPTRRPLRGCSIPPCIERALPMP
jgi:hypothetical protein